MNEPVVLLLVQHLFPEWTITRDGGTWKAAGCAGCRGVSAWSVDGLLGMLAVTDPEAARRAASLLRESG